MTSNEIREEFKKELVSLLKKYKANLAVQDTSSHGSDFSEDSLIVEFDYRSDVGIIEDIFIGNYIDGDD